MDHMLDTPPQPKFLRMGLKYFRLEIVMTGSLSKATSKFIAASDWLGEEDQPAVVMMQLVAAQVDKDGPVPALLAQYGLVHRSLLKRAPSAPATVDPLAAALEKAKSDG